MTPSRILDLLRHLRYHGRAAGKSDLLLHCPLMDETYHLINRETIQKMKDGVILVNTSRGGLVKAERLDRVIRARKSSPAVDVMRKRRRTFLKTVLTILWRPLLPPLSFPNVVITSHQGFFTQEALEAISETTLNNARAFLHGETTGNEVIDR